MFEKVNPGHPDKVADRIAGAIVDVAYAIEENPKVAVEVLIGHKKCTIIVESSVELSTTCVHNLVKRISGQDDIELDFLCVKQDVYLAENQADGVRCGDNGIFKGMPTTEEQKELSSKARFIYSNYPTDGKYIINNGKLIICQSNSDSKLNEAFPTDIINPLGYWTGGTDVDTGATNRKLGSDMGDAVTGGGLHGKDLSKADVSVNIFAHLQAQKLGVPVSFCCAIGDETVGGIPYEQIVNEARAYIDSIGGFEKFAEWGLI